jgi:ubiquinone/menaquinone biosynthesis C-methylase UbiE
MTTSNDPFPSSEFDVWAESYDGDVASQGQFPFDGYEKVLDTVIHSAASARGMTILDIGTGTGNLALRFGRYGCEVWCMDFSEDMLAQARQKLPEAHFVLHDMRAPWPAELDRRFDRIVSAYVFHHFELGKKVELCKELTARRLTPGGKLIIADLSFPNQREMEAFAQSVGDLWEQEPYWLADESLVALTGAGLRPKYFQVSACAGVYALNA